MSTNVRAKLISTATKENAGRTNVYHDVFDGTVNDGALQSSTLVGKLRKNRGSEGYVAFAMNTDGSRTEVGTFETKSKAAHAARSAFVTNGGVLPEGPKAVRKPRAAKATPAPVATDADAKREKANARRRELRAAKKAQAAVAA